MPGFPQVESNPAHNGSRRSPCVGSRPPDIPIAGAVCGWVGSLALVAGSTPAGAAT